MDDTKMMDGQGDIAAAYAEALEFLASQTKFGINLGLQRITRLLELMGEPHRQGVKYIHIGGTNGKGSVSAFVAAMLRAAGYRTAVFNSPHLHSYRERYVIDGEMISREEVVRRVGQLKPILAQMQAEGAEQPTEFELSTALALRYFTDQQVDYAVIEVGMGGAIDSTNVIMPELALITNVATPPYRWSRHTHRPHGPWGPVPEWRPERHRRSGRKLCRDDLRSQIRM